MKPPITALIPAAGCSSRMGAFKPLLPFGSSTLIERVIANAEQGCDEVVLVVGFRGDDLVEQLTSRRGREPRPRLRIVHNDRWECGMLGSIQRGAREVTGEYFFVAPADMPYLSPEIYTTLAARRPRFALFPERDGRWGHPVLVSSAVIPELLEADLERLGSMRRFLARYPTESCRIDSDAIFVDLDTIEQYRAAVR